MIQLDGAGAVLTMFGTIAASATLTGQGTIKASGGRLDIHGAVDATAASTISFEIDSTPGSLLEFDSTVGTGAIHPTITFDSGSSELLDLSTMSATALQNFDGVVKNFAPGEGIKTAGATSAALDASDPTHSHVIVSGGSGTLATLDLGASYQGRTFTVTSNVVMVSATVTPPPVVTESLKNNTGTAGDKLTSDPTLTDSGDPNAVVHFTIDGIQIAATTTADASGAWTLTPTGLGDGPHTIVASETNAGGTGTASLTFTLDTKAPTVTVSAASASLKGGRDRHDDFCFQRGGDGV